MKIIKTPIEGVFLIYPRILGDERGRFARTFCKKEFAEAGIHESFVQFNHSLNFKKGTIRGMHFQHPPFAESKLIRCVQGSVTDVAVDIRMGSPTFLQHFSIELTAENMISILIPAGCAHGFQAMEDNTALIYHHSEYYTPQADAGFRYNDPALNIRWELPAVNVSEKDKNYILIDKQFKGIKI
ncbi:MAG: dTDP-4-dehydrorhamnose 3,5-epimerase [Bacteroidia bacterium]|nr:dTDP-4-dehydrorhamnose 3,5-epimerase [Bacteroidia bacterium]